MGENRSRPEQYQLRLPVGLRDRIKADAEANGRSMNAEIIARLEKPADVVGLEAVLEGLYAISRRLDRIEQSASAVPHHHAGNIARHGGVLVVDAVAGMRRGV